MFQVAQVFPEARVLAVDISLPSLAYARRKTREEGLRNIAYAQADILKLERSAAASITSGCRCITPSPRA